MEKNIKKNIKMYNEGVSEFIQWKQNSLFLLPEYSIKNLLMIKENGTVVEVIDELKEVSYVYGFDNNRVLLITRYSKNALLCIWNEERKIYEKREVKLREEILRGEGQAAFLGDCIYYLVAEKSGDKNQIYALDLKSGKNSKILLDIPQNGSGNIFLLNVFADNNALWVIWGYKDGWTIEQVCLRKYNVEGKKLKFESEQKLGMGIEEIYIKNDSLSGKKFFYFKKRKQEFKVTFEDLMALDFGNLQLEGLNDTVQGMLNSGSEDGYIAVWNEEEERFDTIWEEESDSVNGQKIQSFAVDMKRQMIAVAWGGRHGKISLIDMWTKECLMVIDQSDCLDVCFWNNGLLIGGVEECYFKSLEQ